MTRRAAVGAVIAAVAAVVVIGVVVSQRDGGSAARPASTAGLATRTIEAGAVTVKIAPRRVDASGAEFAVSFDTHSVDLGFDVARASTLSVGGTRWRSPAWSGDGPGGHHREGTLRFTSAGAAAGQVDLVLDGLAEPVEASWTLAES